MSERDDRRIEYFASWDFGHWKNADSQLTPYQAGPFQSITTAQEAIDSQLRWLEKNPTVKSKNFKIQWRHAPSALFDVTPEMRLAERKKAKC